VSRFARNVLRSLYAAVSALALLLGASDIGAHPAPTACSELQQSSASEVRPYSKSVSVLLEDSEHLFTCIGIVAAGIWAYYNYFRGRTYRPRLEPKLSATLMGGRSHSYLAIGVIVKNVGLSKVDIKQSGTVITVFAGTVPDNLTRARELDWSEIRLLTVLSDHAWIEPGEEIEERYLLALPATQCPMYRAEIRIASPIGQTWSIGTIATPKADPA
jgi:hypothetical protein